MELSTNTQKRLAIQTSPTLVWTCAARVVDVATTGTVADDHLMTQGRRTRSAEQGRARFRAKSFT